MEHEARRAETLTSLGTIAAGVAHDLNNPLAIVLSRAELLLAMPGEALSAQMVREDLAVMHRQAQRASRIVEQFVELSRHGSKTACRFSKPNPSVRRRKRSPGRLAAVRMSSRRVASWRPA